MRLKLLDVVSTLIRERPRQITYQDISDATGVSTSQLNRIAHLKHRGFPVDEVQSIYEYLTDSDLVPVIYRK